MAKKFKKIDVKSLLDTEELQYALDNFASILRNLEYFENNFEQIKTQPIELFALAATGYYVALGSLISNTQGMDYTDIFKLWDIILEKNTDYPEQNKALKHNIDALRKWEVSLDHEMKHILNIRNKYFAHIDFVGKDFLWNSFANKDPTKQNDLVKFFRCMLEASEDYKISVLKEFARRSAK